VDRKQATAVTTGKVVASAQKMPFLSNPAISLGTAEKKVLELGGFKL
jgi:hypothetical protein